MKELHGRKNCWIVLGPLPRGGAAEFVPADVEEVQSKLQPLSRPVLAEATPGAEAGPGSLSLGLGAGASPSRIQPAHPATSPPGSGRSFPRDIQFKLSIFLPRQGVRKSKAGSSVSSKTK